MKVAISIGSNLRNPQANALAAIAKLGELGQMIAQSSLYLTKPWGFVDQPDFINAAVIIEVSMNPFDLLAKTQEIEREMGRAPTFRWGPRLIDIDILTFENLILDEPGLKLPHPHMKERAFVLAPLSEIDKSYGPDFQKLSEEDRSQVRPLEISILNVVQVLAP